MSVLRWTLLFAIAFVLVAPPRHREVLAARTPVLTWLDVPRSEGAVLSGRPKSRLRFRRSP